jgi:D-ribose pyranase
MKKQGILNQPISSIISSMGHTDQLTICDAGLPIPRTVDRIDLALVPGLPGFCEVVEVFAREMAVERIILAEEIKESNPEIEAFILKVFNGVEVVYEPHSEFKKLTQNSCAVIRTGECTPFANIILVSGVIF